MLLGLVSRAAGRTNVDDITAEKSQFFRAVGSPLVEGHRRRWLPVAAVQALEQLTAGIIVTDHCAKVVEINRAGDSIVQLEDGLVIREDRLCARRVFETTKITKLIAGATTEGKSNAAARRMLVGRGDTLPAFVLTVTPLRTGFAIDAAARTDRCRRPDAARPVGNRPRGILWVVTGGGAACGSSDSRQTPVCCCG